MELGFPLVVRPSYVLGGRAMAIIPRRGGLRRLSLGDAAGARARRRQGAISERQDRPDQHGAGQSPLLFDRYLTDAIEVDVDALCDGQDVFIAGVMEHIEEAGIHSGDSACSLRCGCTRFRPTIRVAELERQNRRHARALKVGGLMNVQYAIKDGEVFVLEVNPRASRTVPSSPRPWDARRQDRGPHHGRREAGELRLEPKKLDHIAVKEAVFPFARFPGVDTVLGPEMRSTGEVMGLSTTFPVAFAKSQLGGGTKVPTGGTVFVSVRESDKARILDAVKRLADLGFRVVATSGTQRYLVEHGVPAERINKAAEGRPHIVDAIRNGEIQLVFNTTDGRQAMRDSSSLRRAALLQKVPYYTTLAGAVAAARGIEAWSSGVRDVRPLQAYFDTAEVA